MRYFWKVLLVICIVIFSPISFCKFLFNGIPTLISEWRLYKKIKTDPREYKKLSYLEKGLFISFLHMMQNKWYIKKSTKKEMRDLEDKLFNVQELAEKLSQNPFL